MGELEDFKNCVLINMIAKCLGLDNKTHAYQQLTVISGDLPDQVM